MTGVRWREEGDGEMAEHGAQVNITWRLTNFDTKKIDSESVIEGESFTLDNPKAWYYCFTGHRIGSVCQVKIRREGVRMYYSAVLINVLSNPSKIAKADFLIKKEDSDSSIDGPLSNNENAKIVVRPLEDGADKEISPTFIKKQKSSDKKQNN